MSELASDFSAPRLSVVKIFVRSVGSSFTSPWQMRPQRSSTGSGLCIDKEKRWVLTNNHVVDDAVSVRVRRYGDPVLYLAKVVCVSPQCDLAVLHVNEASFWEGVQPIALTENVPTLDSDVITIGYPKGGDNISVTRGVVSRIDLMDYTFSAVAGERLPVIQVDAAINPGNSGGPVLGTGGCAVGVAFGGLRGNTEGIGYVIPGSVALFFLRTFVATGTFSGLSSLGIRVQPLQSPSLRIYHRLPTEAGANGVLVTAVAPLSSAAKAGLQAGDTLLAVDGIPVAEDSTVPFRNEGSGERIGFDFLVTRKAAGEMILLLVGSGAGGRALAAGASGVRQLEFEVGPVRRLVPKTRHVDAAPSYLVVGGLVFVRLTLPWLEQRFSNLQAAPPELLQKLSSFKQVEDEEVVILAKVLAAEVNYAYEDFSSIELKEFGTCSIGNNEERATKVNSLKHLRELVMRAAAKRRDDVRRTPLTSFMRFKLAQDLEIVLDASACDDAAASILRQHAIPNDCSVDLLDDHEKQERSRL